jgi:hypothetical protein
MDPTYQSNKERNYKSRNLFNKDDAEPFGTSESSNTFKRHEGHRPPALMRPAKGSIDIGGTDAKYYETEAASNFAHKGYVKREMMRPAAGENWVIARSGTPGATASVSASDYKRHELNYKNVSTKWGNKSDDVFFSGNTTDYKSEAAMQFGAGGAGGRPSTSCKPSNAQANKNNVMEPGAKFEGRSQASSDFTLHVGAYKRGSSGPPRAKQSQITEQNLIHHTGEKLDIYRTEASLHFGAKPITRLGQIRPVDEGLGFCIIGSKDDRNYVTESAENHTKKPYIPVEKPAMAKKGTYTRVADDRDWVSETKANHSLNGFQVKPIPKEELQTRPGFLKSNSRAASRQTSRVASRQTSRAASRVPETREVQDNSYFDDNDAAAFGESDKIARSRGVTPANLSRGVTPSGRTSAKIPTMAQAAASSGSQAKRTSQYSRPSSKQPSIGQGMSGIKAVARK